MRWQLRQILPRIHNLSGNRARGNRHRRCEEHLRFFVAHAAGKITIRRADAFDARFVDAAKGVNGAAQARGATGVLRHLHAGVGENFPNRFFAPTRGLQIMDDFRRRRNAESKPVLRLRLR